MCRTNHWVRKSSKSNLHFVICERIVFQCVASSISRHVKGKILNPVQSDFQVGAAKLEEKSRSLYPVKLGVDEYVLKFVALGLTLTQTHFEFAFPDQLRLEIDKRIYPLF